MATRTLPSRKVKVDTRERLEEEKLSKSQNKPKVNGNPTSKTVKKKAVDLNSAKSKTDDDLEVVKKKQPALKRRSKSVEPLPVSKSKIAKVAKKETILEDVSTVPAPVKKGRAIKPTKKAAAQKMAVPEATIDAITEEVPTVKPSNKKMQKKQTNVTEKNSDDSSEADFLEAKVVSKKNDSEPKKKVEIKSKAKADDTDEPIIKAPKLDSSESEKPKTEDEASPPSSKAAKTLLNDFSTDYEKIDFAIKEKFNMKIVTWNVAGIRALMQKNPDYFAKENADIICLNELKCGSEKEVPSEAHLEGYKAYWNIGKSVGGVAILSKIEPISVTYNLPDFEDEKRMITAEYEKFFLVATYVVNSGRGLKTLEKRLKWNEAFDEHVKSLDKTKPVIIAGDLNVSHQEIDLANPKTNKKNAGFTQEERDGFTKLLSLGFVDSFRHLYPEKANAYTYWSYITKSRAKNVGWRLDYFVVSERLMSKIKDNVMRSTVMGSDHCPIVLFLDI